MNRDAAITKLTRPKMEGILPRKRLFRLLESGRDRPITWVAGPAGSGKTTLVASWLDSLKLPCLWYQIDEGDNDVASFFYYMGLAAKKAAPRYRRPMPLLTPEFLQGVPTFTRRYFEKFYGRLKSPFSIVIDNFQDAPSPVFHEILSHAFETVPEGINVLVLSRAEPPEKFARLRANNKMAMVGWNDLSFTFDECREFSKKKDGRLIPDETIKYLYEKTEGWAAALVLMTEATKTKGIPYSFISELTKEAVFNYFANEIFEKAAKETRDFLLKTSFFPSMGPDAAEKLTGNSRAGAILSGLSRNHYFTDWRPLPAPAFQYHPLFREFLQAKARDVFEHLELVDILRRTGTILEKEGRTDEAAVLYKNAEAWEDLVGLLLTYAQSLIGQGRHKTLEEWLRSLPEEVIGSSPWLLYWLGSCRIAFDPYESRALLERSFELFMTAKDATGLFLSWASIIDTFVFAWGDFEPLDRWIAIMEKILAEQPEFPSPEIEVRVAECMLCAMANRQPGRIELVRWAERVQQIVLTSNDVQLQMMLGSQLVFYYLWVGDFSKIAPVVETLRPSDNLKRHDPLTKQNWYVWKATYSWFVADWSACRQAISDGMKNAEDSGIHLLDLHLLAHGVFGGLTLGDPFTAISCLEKMALTKSPRPGDKALYQYQAASVAWYNSQFKRSIEHGKLAVEITRKIGWPVPIVLCLIDLSATLFDADRHDEADDCLAKALQICRGMNGLEFLASINGAKFAFERNKDKQGLDFLKRGMALGARYDYLNMPRWRPHTMAYLCAVALENDIEPEYVRRLIIKRGLVPEYPVENWPYPIKIYTLGGFKLLKNDGPVEFSGKVRKRPLLMLKALTAQGGKGVREGQLADMLWPEADGDAALKSVNVTITRLRQLLGVKEAVGLKDGLITLNPSYCWVDAFSFLELSRQVDEAERKGEDAASLIGKALDLYKGTFLQGEDQPWAASLRERLFEKFLRYSTKQGRIFEAGGEYERAADCYLKALEIDELPEEFYRRLMVCYDKLGRKTEAVSVYNRCKRALSTLLGIGPSAETTAIYKGILKKPQ